MLKLMPGMPSAKRDKVRETKVKAVDMSHLNMPHGGRLVDLLVSKEDAEKLRRQSSNFKSWNLTHRQVCDVEMLLNGAFSPLIGFMNEQDYIEVCKNYDYRQWWWICAGSCSYTY